MESSVSHVPEPPLPPGPQERGAAVAVATSARAGARWLENPRGMMDGNDLRTSFQIRIDSGHGDQASESKEWGDVCESVRSISRNYGLPPFTIVCQTRSALHYPAMKPAIWLPFSCALLHLLTSCGNQSSTAANDPLGTGPFDSQGRYREEWADDPTKWRRPGKRHQEPAPADDLPVIAKNEQPPADASPLAAGTPASKPVSSRVEATPRETAQRTQTAGKTTTAPKPTPVVVKAKPKPVVVKAKPKPKPKPKSTRYIVKKGDSLSRIASRNGSSVSAIQKANGISGTLIRPGQSLVIPKR